jgi:alkylated DNA repair protein (DNA oxidative demethylase)
MLLDLLKDRRELALGPGAMLLGGFALDDAPALLDAIAAVAVLAPFRHMETPGGWRMSVAMTTCGAAGWTTSRRGYRYTPDGPVSDRPWPAMPDAFLDVARRAAMAAGYTPPPAAAGEVLGPILTAALDRHTTCARWAAYFVEPI